MRFHIVTLFPQLIEGYITDSILSRAIENKLLEVHFYNPREHSIERHKKVDDRPYGGGPGMVMTVQPLVETVLYIKKKLARKRQVKLGVFLMSPGGDVLTNSIGRKLATKYTDIILISGRYEGIDARVKKILRAKEISVGDYVLTGGELPAMTIVDVVSRQIEGVLGRFDSLEEERVSSHEMYTRPEVYEHEGKKYRVPKVLIGGNHAEIEKYRRGEK